MSVFNWWEVWPKSWSILIHVSSEISSTNLLTICLYIWHLVFRVVRPIVYYYCFDVWPFDARDVTYIFFVEKKARNNDAWRWNISPSNRINLCMFGQVRRSSRCWIAVVHAVGYFHWISSVCFQFRTNFIFNTRILSELRLLLRKSHEPKNEKCDAFHIYSEIKIRLVSLN